MDLFLSMEAFVRVAECGSFSLAARQLGTAKSVVTKRVKALETRLELPLFHRSTRAVRLSEAGENYYRESRHLVTQVEALNERTRELRRAPAGLLRIHVLPGFALGRFATLLNDFRRLHPTSLFEVQVSDRVVDPVQAGIDLAIQIFPPASEDLVERRLFPVHGFFCATRAFLEQAGEIQTPQDLQRLQFATYTYLWGNHWPLVVQHTGERLELDLTPVLRSNSIHLVREFALSGAGVAYLPNMVAAEDLQAGRLQRVLPGLTAPPLWLSAVYPASHRGTEKVKVFLEYLAAHSAPPEMEPFA